MIFTALDSTVHPGYYQVSARKEAAMSCSDIINTHFRRADQVVTIKELCFNNHIATEREVTNYHTLLFRYLEKIN